ncbi:MAG: DinB family protein [Gemmatimonadales bacterium]
MESRWIAAVFARDLDTWRQEIEAFPDEASIWVAPEGVTNSAGTLTLHIAGNLSHFVGAVLGGTGYVRNREHEFAGRDVPRAELVSLLGQAKATVEATLGGASPVDLDGVYPEAIAGRYRIRTGDWLTHLVSHCGLHLGQVGYLRRIVTGTNKAVTGTGLATLTTLQPVEPA